jgi:hypothetical protein
LDPDGPWFSLYRLKVRTFTYLHHLRIVYLCELKEIEAVEIVWVDKVIRKEVVVLVRIK